MVPHTNTHTHTQTHTQDLTVLSSLGAKQIRFGARARSCCLQVATTSSFSTHTAFTRPVSSHVTTRMVFPFFFFSSFFLTATFLFWWYAPLSFFGGVQNALCGVANTLYRDTRHAELWVLQMLWREVLGLFVRFWLDEEFGLLFVVESKELALT